MVSEEQALAAVAVLAVATGGNSWTDDTVEFYVKAFTTYEDPDVLATACQEVVGAWARGDKPPLGIVAQQYQAVKRRQDSVRGELGPSPTSFPSFEEGLEIARQAYHAECYRQGREPTAGMVESWFGEGREDRRQVEALGRSRRG